MKFEVSEKVFAFTMLLYSQQLFIQMFNPEADKEWKKIQPIVKELHEALSEENRIKGRNKALQYNGQRPVIEGFDDLWYIMYIVSNYRVNWIQLGANVDREEIKILRYALINVAKKSHKRYSEFRSRHI
jgi:hypothetical protein|tara:strand:- start:139 stop:525 length:387 start_codon:yes stop_codon:yes gene_type:complete